MALASITMTGAKVVDFDPGSGILSFEDGVVPAIPGEASVLTVSDAHFKLGNKSLEWHWKRAGAEFHIPGNIPYLTENPNPKETSVSTFVFWVYSPSALEGNLRFSFMKGEKECCHFDYTLGFTGWRGSWVAFDRDMEGNPEEGMDRVIVSAPEGCEEGTLYFDGVITSAFEDVRHHTPDWQTPFVNKDTDSHWLVLNNSWNLKLDIPEETSVSDEEKKGLQVLQRVVKSEPDNGFAQLFMADYFRSKGDTTEADKLLRNVLVNDRVDNGLKVQYLLKLLVNQKELQLPVGKIYAYEQILLQRYPEDLSVRTLNADFLKRMNQLDLCLDELEFLVSKEPDNFLVWEELLLMYNQLQDTAAMYDKGLECLRYFPNESLPYMAVSLPLLLRGETDSALPYLKKGLELAEDGTVIKSQFYSYLGDCYYEQDSVDLAFSMYDEALKINPNDVLVLNNYSYFLALRGERLEEAEEMISKAVSMNPGNGTFLDTYAWVLFKRKDYSLAKFYIRSALEDKESVSAVMYEHYGDILYMNGEKEEAVKMWQMALKMGGDVNKDDLVNKIENGLPTDDEE